jgi:UDP-N-acetylglucosamine 2-epimerase
LRLMERQHTEIAGKHVYPRTLARLAGVGTERASDRAAGPATPVSRCRLAPADSSSIQEEATVFGIPCLTSRPNIERPITCEIGTTVLVGSDSQAICTTALAALNENGRPPRPGKWAGRAAGCIPDLLLASAVR